MNLGEVVLGLAGLYFGAKTVQRSAERLAGGLTGPRTTVTANPQRALPPMIRQGQHMPTLAGQMRMTTRRVATLDDRMAQLIALAQDGKFDPSVIAWTRRELSRKRANAPNQNGGQWLVPEKDTKAEITAIFNAMRRDIAYRSDIYGADTYMHPRVTLRTRTGDCDDLSTFACASLMSVGIPCRFKVIRTKGAPSWDHVYVQAGTPKGDPKQWITVDASVPVKAGWEAPASMVAEARIFEVR